MHKKGGVAVALDGTGIKKPAELAVPKKESYSGYTLLPENHLFGVQVELLIKAPNLGENKQGD